MKLLLNLSLFVFFFFLFSNKAYPLTDYQIKRMCKKEIRETDCIKNFQEKRSKLQKGNLIEITVVPFKSN